MSDHNNSMFILSNCFTQILQLHGKKLNYVHNVGKVVNKSDSSIEEKPFCVHLRDGHQEGACLKAELHTQLP